MLYRADQFVTTLEEQKNTQMTCDRMPVVLKSHELGIRGKYMVSAALQQQLLNIRSLIYQQKSCSITDAQAIGTLTRLVDQRIPQAIHQYALLLWHGFGIEQNADQAFSLASEALSLGDKDALVTIGAMHFVGAGCEKDFEKALRFYRRFAEEADIIPLVRIGGVSLSYFEFRTEFTMDVNGLPIQGSLFVLEELNRWLLQCKQKWVNFQTAALAKNPNAYGGMAPRNLPYKGSIGGSCFSLRGRDRITHVGMRDLTVNEEIWFETERLTGWPMGITFDGLTTFGEIPPDEIRDIGRAYLTNMHRGHEFELKLIGTSVHRESQLLCGGEVVMSAFED